MANHYEQIKTLRDLATALERRDAALTLPGTSCPDQIVFQTREGVEYAGYGNNPTLLDEMKREMRLRWSDLRAAAFARMDDDVARLSAGVALFVIDSMPKEPSP